ncbi:hypothetical protein [Roseateles chitinivorans]|uniref:hypothetical protein n=1 Tax=Roseateles chitinivorans TaxID=2917965 RepID=UPI003D66A29C
MKHSIDRAWGALRSILGSVAFATAMGATGLAQAADGKITAPILEVMVNGGPDTANGGLTCFSMPGLPEECRGVIAIPNRNKDLLAAALLARLRGGDTNVYFDRDWAKSHHCPNVTFSSCAAISISVK